MELRIKKLFPNARIPVRKKAGDSGLDLAAFLPEGPVFIRPGARERIRTGIAIELPPPMTIQGVGLDAYEAQVRPRSGLASEHGIQACFGTVDNGYRGEIWVNLFNLSFNVYRVADGDRIAQLVIVPVVLPAVVEVEELSETERGADGFGSTGV